jgi:hypothetical protein
MDGEWVLSHWDLVVLMRRLGGVGVGWKFRMVLESRKVKKMEFKNK